MERLVGDSWFFGSQCRFSRAELDDRLAIPVSIWNYADQNLTATLHQFRLFARCHFQNGFFVQSESLFITQENDGYRPDLRGDDVWQLEL